MNLPKPSNPKTHTFAAIKLALALDNACSNPDTPSIHQIYDLLRGNAVRIDDRAVTPDEICEAIADMMRYNVEGSK